MIATIVEFDGEEGLAEDIYGDMHRFSLFDILPMDKKHVELGIDICIPEEGWITLASTKQRVDEEQEYDL